MSIEFFVGLLIGGIVGVWRGYEWAARGAEEWVAEHWTTDHQRDEK